MGACERIDVMPKVHIFIGTIKKCEEYKGLHGVELLLIQFDDDENLGILGVTNIDDMEKFYRFSYENGLKQLIDDDYEYCLWYVLNGDCGLTCHIKFDYIENIHEITKQDDARYEKAVRKFKRCHHYYEIEKRLEDKENLQTKANQEFKNAPKKQIEICTKGGSVEVQAIIYKGFAIHDPYGYEPDVFKNITSLDGEYKGLTMGSFDITICKKLIDEIREKIGDRPVNHADENILKPIIQRYK